MANITGSLNDISNNLSANLSNIQLPLQNEISKLTEGAGKPGVGPYITVSDFSVPFINEVQSLVKNAGDCFLNGTPSSIYTNVNDGQKLIKAASSGIKAATDVKKIAQTIDNTDFDAVGDDMKNFIQKSPQLMAELAETMTKKIAKETLNYVTQKTMAIIDPSVIVTALTKLTTECMQKGIKAGNDVLKELTTPSEKAMEEAASAAEEAEKSKTINEMNEQVAAFKEKATKTVSDINKGISVVKPYIQHGPQKLAKVADSYVCKGMSIFASYIDKGADFLIKKRDKFLKNMSEKAGEKMAAAVNKTTTKMMSKQLSEAKIKANIVVFKATGVLMSAVQIVVAQLGPQLGKVVKTAAQQGVKQLISKIPI